MNSTRVTGRLAGILYLLSGLPGVFSYLYIPSKLIVPTDATATAHNIAAAQLTYRLGIASDLFGQIALILLVLYLFNLLRDVDRKYASLMVTLVVVGVAFELVNSLNLMAPLILWSGADFLSVFTKPQLDALALAFLNLRASGLFVAQIFWGLWLLPFGMLVIKSGFFPRILGVLLIIGAVAYVAASAAFIVLPAHAHMVVHVGQALGGLGEGAMVLWLLVRGARVPAMETTSSHPT